MYPRVPKNLSIFIYSFTLKLLLLLLLFSVDHSIDTLDIFYILCKQKYEIFIKNKKQKLYFSFLIFHISYFMQTNIFVENKNNILNKTNNYN